jgi:TRAP-type C4-dicarboxylate transport system permease small subunit
MAALAARIEDVLARTLLAAIVVLVFAAALARSFGHPLIWSVDMAQLLFIWLCFFGAARAMREKGHLGIDLFVRYFSPRNRFRLELVISAVILVFLGLLAVEGYRLTMLNMARQFGDSGFSYAWVTSAVPIGAVMLGVALCRNIARAWVERRTGKQLIYSRTEADGVATMEL